MKRREFLGTAGAIGAGIAVGVNPLKAAESRPNVLLIECDQMREPVWTLPGITPNVDRLRKSGVSFTRHFTSAVPCSPSRACLFTGTYTTQNKMLSNCDFVEGNLQPSLDPKIPTLGHVFRDAGYRTPYRGKWHLTRKKDHQPSDPLIEYGFEGWKKPDAPFGGPPFFGAALDPIYTNEATDWLLNQAKPGKPWFLTCNLVNPHDICAFPRYYPYTKFREIRTERAPDNWKDSLKGKPNAQREYQKHYEKVGGPMDLDNPDSWRRYLDYYAVCIEDVDQNIGRLLDALEKSGQAENTVIVFTADHGEMGGSHRLRTKGCFAYEEVMRVPLIFSWPGRISAGVEAKTLASNVDVMPTLASLAGLGNLPYMAGVDLAPALTNADIALREEIIYHNDWEVQLTIGKSADATSIYKSPAHIRCIRQNDWKYAYYFSPGRTDTEFELYNLKDDPLEMSNLANDAGYLAKRRELHDRLMELENKYEVEYK